MSTPTPITGTTAHECPGRCGVTVSPQQFACTADWERLPPEVRTAIRSTWDRGNVAEHLQALALARSYFVINPPTVPMQAVRRAS